MNLINDYEITETMLKKDDSKELFLSLAGKGISSDVLYHIKPMTDILSMASTDAGMIAKCENEEVKAISVNLILNEIIKLTQFISYYKERCDYKIVIPDNFYRSVKNFPSQERLDSLFNHIQTNGSTTFLPYLASLELTEDVVERVSDYINYEYYRFSKDYLSIIAFYNRVKEISNKKDVSLDDMFNIISSILNGSLLNNADKYIKKESSEIELEMHGLISLDSYYNYGAIKAYHNEIEFSLSSYKGALAVSGVEYEEDIVVTEEIDEDDSILSYEITPTNEILPFGMPRSMELKDTLNKYLLLLNDFTEDKITKVVTGISSRANITEYDACKILLSTVEFIGTECISYSSKINAVKRTANTLKSLEEVTILTKVYEEMIK